MAAAQPDSAAGGLLVRGSRAVRLHGWRRAALTAAQRLAAPALAPVAARTLRRQLRGCAGAQDAVELAFGFSAAGIKLRPLQSRWELAALVAEVERLRPRTMLEIGTANGGSLVALARACDPGARIISVDLPGGAFGGGYPAWRRHLYEAFVTADQRLFLLRGDSHSDATLAHVRELLGRRFLDLLFIDGDHSYEGVRADFARYGALVRRGGIIALHDIAAPRAGSSPFDDPGDVPRFWRELTATRHGEEIVDPRGHGCFGIGLIRV